MSTEVKAFLLFLIEFSFMMIIGVFNIVIWLTLSGVVKVIRSEEHTSELQSPG